MADVPMWRVLAYMDNDSDSHMDESRTLAEWQLQDWLRWATTRGYDNLYFTRSDVTTRFKRATGPKGVVHQFHGVVEEKTGGDTAA